MLARTCTLIALCLASCATTRVPPPAQGMTRCREGDRCGGGVVTLQAEAQVAGAEGFRPIPLNKVLHSGDLVVLSVEADRPVHVYAARVPQKGPPEVFFPAQGEQRTAPRVPLHIPADGGSIRLDSTPGQEDLRVVASAHPLDPQQLQQLLAEPLRETPRDPPDNPKEKDRETYLVRGELDERGTAVLRFVIQHR